MTEKPMPHENALQSVKVGSFDWMQLIQMLLSIITQASQHGPMMQPIVNAATAQLKAHSDQLAALPTPPVPQPGMPTTMQSGPDRGPPPVQEPIFSNNNPRLSPDPEPHIPRRI